MFDIGAVFQFISDHKYWLAALVPVLLAIGVIKARG